jgi:heme exporter protein C
MSVRTSRPVAVTPEPGAPPAPGAPLATGVPQTAVGQEATVGQDASAPLSVRPADAAAARPPAPRTDRFLAVHGVVTAVAVAALLAGALLYAPTDRLQGPSQRIFYIHVPAAWIGMLAFFVVFVASIGYLVTRASRWDRLAASSAEVGVVFTTGVMVTGPLWARPVWGVYWDWDPRLTSFFVLWLLYLSYLILRSYVPEPTRRARYSAVLGIVAFLDVPLVYVSVRWWRTLHPEPVVVNTDGPQLPGSMLAVLLVGIVAFTLLSTLLLRLRLANARREEVLAAPVRARR